ncbi:MAG: ATP-dependent DNA helicase PcrA [Candidatus Wolfebacteria bacterium GW2011_GWC2_46_275]|nr:MAG: ATP-dependent DNA helicase PcrA [Candidatus Wolfebacteria bacterium GW2011_GWC2_46_275]
MIHFEELNDKQRAAVEHGEGPLLIVAGAGSGKTKTLTSRLAALLHSGVKPENIVAITFTNKAAGEMKERTEKLLAQDKESFKAMFLGTFHSFGARILKKEARLFGRNSNYTIFDADDSKSLIKKVAAGAGLSERDARVLKDQGRDDRPGSGGR